MSAVDVIELIKNLPPSEQAKVRDFALALPSNKDQADNEARVMPREMFERAKEHVFAHYGPLLEKLAK